MTIWCHHLGGVAIYSLATTSPSHCRGVVAGPGFVDDGIHVNGIEEHVDGDEKGNRDDLHGDVVFTCACRGTRHRATT